MPISTEPDESNTIEGSAGSNRSGQGDSGFKSEGIRDSQTFVYSRPSFLDDYQERHE